MSLSLDWAQQDPKNFPFILDILTPNLYYFHRRFLICETHIYRHILTI